MKTIYLSLIKPVRLRLEGTIFKFSRKKIRTEKGNSSK